MPRIPGLVGLAPADVVVVFNPETPDRTAAIEGRGPSPLPWLLESAELLRRLGATHLAYPCNTAHYFLKRAAREGSSLGLPLVDLIDETVTAVAEAGYRCVGLLATSGTVKTRLYQDAFEARGIRVLLPAPSPAHRSEPAAAVGPDGRVRAEEYGRLGADGRSRLERDAFATLTARLVEALGEQDGLVMEAILGRLGVKAGYTAGVAAQLAEEAAVRLASRGAEALVLGCTELPLVLKGPAIEVAGRRVVLIDPARVLADRLRILGGRPGIAGGLGPEATIDLLEKLGLPDDFTAVQRDIFRATIDELGAARDQDHLKMIGAAGPDPVDAARRLADAGAAFLVLSAQAAPWAPTIEGAVGVPVLTACSGGRVGPDVVRRAVLADATPGAPGTQV